MRFALGFAALFSDVCTFQGDASFAERRSCQALIDPLEKLGACIQSANGCSPIAVQGPIQAGSSIVFGEDSQPVSALLFSTALLPEISTIIVKNGKEQPFIDMTLEWLKRAGINVEQNKNSYRVHGKAAFQPCTYSVPGDLSSLAFPLALGLITNSKIRIENASLDDIQGDKEIVFLLQKMGAKFEIGNSFIQVSGKQALTGLKIDVGDIIDTLPILAVIGCFCEGKLELVNAQVARKKESNRIHAICTELKKMGATIVETEDGLIVQKSTLHGADLFSHNDHRIALALTVAALSASTPSTQRGSGCISKTYPSFFHDLLFCGGNISFL